MANVGEWRQKAARVIAKVHATIPADATLKERTTAIDAAYPFGERNYHPYKMWLIERRNYLAQYGHRTKQPMPEPTPLELAIASAGKGE